MTKKGSLNKERGARILHDSLAKRAKGLPLDDKRGVRRPKRHAKGDMDLSEPPSWTEYEQLIRELPENADMPPWLMTYGAYRVEKVRRQQKIGSWYEPNVP